MDIEKSKILTTPRDNILICPISAANLQVARDLVCDDTLSRLPDDQAKRLSSMLVAMEHHAHTWPCDKTGRWLGFIQGILFSHDLLDVDEERDRTRPIFHKAYEEAGLRIPSSIDVEQDDKD